MKNPLSIYTEIRYLSTTHQILDVIKKAQIESYNEGLKAAASLCEGQTTLNLIREEILKLKLKL